MGEPLGISGDIEVIPIDLIYKGKIREKTRKTHGNIYEKVTSR
jgi:hypothetical protein